MSYYPKTPGEQVVLCLHDHDGECSYARACYRDVPATYAGPMALGTLEDSIGVGGDHFRRLDNDQVVTLTSALDGPYGEQIRRPDQPSKVGAGIGWPYDPEPELAGAPKVTP